MIGETIREFEFLSELGAGGYGAVYRAHDTSVNRDVAIKVILPQYSNKPEFIASFEAEARLVAQLEHINIVPLYAYWRDDSGAYLVMRYIRGGSLRSMIAKQGALPLNKVLRLIEQIADALHTAHEAGVVHRDLKPDNILIDERGNAYLTDFGIAKRISDDGASATDAIKGTFAYLSPEQIQQTPVSAQTDIYALGLMLYEMLSGKHPFHDTPIGMMVVKHLQEELPDIRDIREELSGAINDIIQKATAKAPEHRFESTLALFAAFQEAVSGAPNAIAQPTSSVKKQSSTSEERNRHAMLQNVRKFWIEGVLENSLHDAAMIDLGMKPESGAVDNPWDTLLRTPSGDETLSNESIVHVFDRMNGKLLILGDPGSGKTTTLLTLARELLYRAEMDDQHPIPVVFNLSSWSEQQLPLEEWLVEELNGKYQVPRKVATQWLEEDELLLLLDGLDEVSEATRNACVQAVNTYRGEHGFVDVVVCSRIKDYEALANQLKLNGAIVIQPLNDTQIVEYLNALGQDVAIVRELIMRDAQLRELAQSPLMLSIMVLAYRGKTASDVPDFDDIEAQRSHLFATYVQRMFDRRIGEKPHSSDETCHYLIWLAKRMREESISIFHLEELQPGWLTESLRGVFYRSVRIAVALVHGLLTGGAFFLIGSFFGMLNFPPWLVGIGAAVLLAIVGWIWTGDNFHRLKGRIIIGLALGICLGIYAGIRYGALTALIAGSNIFAGALLQYRFASHLLKQTGNTLNHIVVAERLQFSLDKINTDRQMLNWILGALICFVGVGYVFVPRPVDIPRLLLSMIVPCLFFVPGAYALNSLRISDIQFRHSPNQGIRLSGVNAIRIGFANLLQFLIPGVLAVVIVQAFELIPFVIAFVTIPLFSTGFIYGGYACIQHLILRVMLSRYGAMPVNYAAFLDYAASLILLRKVGGGYIFVHRYLLEYFTALDEEQST